MSIFYSDKTIIRFFFLVMILIKFVSTSTNTCKSNAKVSNTDCFTDIIKFNQKKYRAGHAIVTKNGELLIEYSLDEDSSDRLFYGLKNNGRNYFSDDSFIKIINVGNHDGYKNRYESMNRIVKINGDSYEGKEYILSVSTYRTVMELYDIETWSSTIKKAITYFDNQIFSFQFPLLEAKYNNEYVYFIAFSHNYNYEENGVLVGKEEGFKSTIARFKFSSLDFDTNQVTHKEVENNKYSDRAITAFVIDELNIVAVIFVKEFDGLFKFMINYYNFDLSKAYEGYIKLYEFGLSNMVEGKGIYFKAIYLKDYYFAFAYFDDRTNSKSFKFRIIRMYKNNQLNQFEDKIAQNLNNYELNADVTLNDFIKYDNDRLAFISNKGNNNFIILLFYFSDTYSKMKIRIYNYYLENYVLNKEMSIYFWNDYLLYSPTYYDKSDTKDNKDNYSILMIFGFVNGTDFIMDISPYLMDTGYYIEGNDLVTRLLKNLTIDNNIFGYTSTNQIKLISIPEELLFYDLEENQIMAESVIDKNHILKQNKNIIKSDKLYSLEYQYVVNDCEEVIDSMAHTTIDYNSYSNSFPNKTFYGRTNILQFKYIEFIF